jgi:hypothetical protein
MHSIAGVTLPPAALPIRDDWWLAQMLDRIWTQHFADTPRINVVSVTFGGVWKTRLGLITMTEDQTATFIEINRLLRLIEVPDVVAKITVAHELVHYAHGFGSPLPRRYKHPHRGGIVKRELLRRGMAADYDKYDAWVYDRWYDLYGQRVAGEPGVPEPMEPGQVALRLPPE